MLALTRCEPREPAETTLTRCTSCDAPVDCSDALLLGDYAYCHGACAFIAACDRYLALNGVVKGSEALALAGVFAGLSASLLRGVVQAAKGDLIALAAVERGTGRAEDVLSTVRYAARLAIEEASGRPESRDAVFARAVLAGDLAVMTAHVTENEDRRFHERCQREGLTTCLCSGQGRIGDEPCRCKLGDAGRAVAP
jgi:hypothetical protein